MASCSELESCHKEHKEMHSEFMSVTFQRGFKQLLDSGDFVDLTVCAQGENFKLQKSVLCATIPYFKSLFLSNFKESGEDHFEISGITADGFRQVIEFVYTGKLHLTKECIQEVLQTADFLQVNEALILCDEYLRSCFNKINNEMPCVYSLREIYDLSVLYHRVDLIENILCGIKHTGALCPGIYDLPVAAIIDILGDNTSLFSDENDALYLAKKWLLMPDAVDGNRLKFAKDVLSKIRLQLLSKECLKKKIYEEEGFKGIEGLKDFIQEKLENIQVCPGENFFNLHLPQRQRDWNLHYGMVVILSDKCECEKKLFSFPSVADIKSLPSQVEVMAYELNPSSTSFVQNSHIINSHIIQSPPCPKKLLFDLHVGTISQYVLCIMSYLDIGEATTSVVIDLFAYDFLTKIWCKLSSPKLPRVNFSFLCLNTCLYIIGGQLANESYTSTIEMYSPKQDTWRTISPLPKPTAYCRSLEYGGDLYVMGGLTENGPSRNLFHLPAGTLEFETLAPSPFPFIAHQILWLQPYIVVINADPRCLPECRENCLVAFYNVNTKEWVSSLVRRKVTTALKAHIFDKPVLDMVQTNAEGESMLVFQENKIQLVNNHVRSPYTEVCDVSKKFWPEYWSEEMLDSSCRLLAATLVRLDLSV